ncbi:MAG: outer membrane beta-barrel protein [Xanthomonadaceae bacterium]|jgi:outer membrane protein|nr:outer membrane beta-barrel protein [Xanthomonadaceae bacterium]
MRVSHLLSLAIASTLAFAPAAFAQSDTASGKRFAVVGSATLIEPHNPTSVIKTDGSPGPSASFSWYVNDNMAVELWGTLDRFNHRLRVNQVGKIGSVKQQPVALSFQYHLGHADNVFRPFAGVGYGYSSFNSLRFLGVPDGTFKVKSANGVVGTLGVDLNINPTWFARADVRYMRSRPDLEANGFGKVESWKIDPWMVSFGLGARF